MKKLFILKKLVSQALVVWPCFLGLTLGTGVSAGQAEIPPTPKLDRNTAPWRISDFEISQTTVTPDGEEHNIKSDVKNKDTAVESAPNSQQTTPEPDPKIEDTTTSNSNSWHFLFQPYLYLPVTIYGDTTVGRVSGDVNVDSNQITTAVKDELNFVFMGDLQAWSPDYKIGILLSVDYLSSSSDSTVNRPVRYSRLADYIPTELAANVDNQLWSVSIAGAYRFYDQSKVNPEGVNTEFDLGLFVFNVFGGLNITGIHTEFDLSSNLGGQASFSDGTTVVSPLLGATLRLNFTPKLALLTTGSVAGFGISGLTKWSVLSGLDWMFSGNTSLGVGYRFGYTSYNSDLDSGKDFGVTLNQNGPYLSFSFRF